MRITILSTNKIKSINAQTLMDLEVDNCNKELLGQLTTDRDATFDPDRISHTIKNVHYNATTMTLDCEIECLATPYGNQLKILLDKHPEKLKFIPIYVHTSTLKLYTVNAIIQRENK